MLSNIIDTALKNRLWIFLFTVGLFLFGIISIFKVSLDALPDISNVIVEVNTKSGSLDPEQVEKTITFFVETELAGIPGVKDIRSLSKFGLSNVVLTFEDGTEIYKARQIVLERLQNVKDKLPDGVTPELTPITTGLGEICMYSVEAKPGSMLEKKSETERLLYLRTVQDLMIRTQIRTNVKNIAEVDTIGGYYREIHIDLIPNKLRTHGISIGEVTKALESVGENFGGGYIEKNDEMIIVRSLGSAIVLENLKYLPIRQIGTGAIIRVNDIAFVREHGMQRVGSATHNGNEIVLGTVMMLMGANSRETVQELKSFFDVIQIPDDVVINVLNERSFLVNATITTISKNLVEGALLVILVLFLVLGNFRASIYVAFVIPLSMLFAAIGMYLFNISANLMSLGAIDFGLLVDAAIVMIENTLAKKEELKDQIIQNPIEFVLESSREILKPVTYGIFIVMFVYIPILTLEGVEGKMFRPMAEAVLLALGGSYVVTLLLIPIFSLSLLKIPNKEKKTGGIKEKINKFYIPILLFGFRNRRIALGISILIFTIATLLFFRMGSDFIPQLKEGDIMITLVRESNISLAKSTELQKKVELILKEFPEINYVFSRTGTTEVANDPMGIYMSDTFVILKKEGILELVKSKNWIPFYMRIKERLEAEFPNDEITIGQPVETRFNELLEGSRADITFRIYGDNLDELIDLQEDAEEILKSIPGANEIELDPISALRKSKVLDIKPNYDKIILYGISLENFNSTFAASMSGITVGSFYEKDLKFPIVVRLSEEFRNSNSSIKSIPIGTPDLGSVQLGDVASLQESEKVMTISRNNGKRYAAISINLGDRDIDSFVKEAKEKISNSLKIPKGYFVFWGGQFKNLEKARLKLAVVVPFTLLIIFLLLLKSFNSVKQAILVYLSIPFAITGGVFALLVRDMNFSISAAIGFIALSGIAILNGVVKVNNINYLRESGLTVTEAVRVAAVSRLRPVLMTALVASFGFIPMAIGEGLGSEVQKPLATVVIGGLISSTILTLFLLPVFYEWIESEKEIKIEVNES
ncbi:Cation transporter [Leptospira biflexa serovar Patoc strain 'Patoc 1 (Ames)']|uniref:Putative cation efflux system protein putative membrane protein n=1 Tax=Leptospira biflexa serovar Patoc (strain Patoc 1 / ATCC 23582 / Paris) TaxID=456481 RepID=B0SQ55_LEPBP|nr:CusA/CzcA family heavy metal efflux RND transporter [Leptospira biflexa]ABZ95502.1 Cation transporter [Leptospira biflexa serovar Patoc strain 'Patoc 1 (Ames)']ABZ99207.1 Putative cation efflux system protein; putative membrane protein [Leptospira biflexa serovar Patoc strain 'Patoc 1 (Paris)']